jgi:hypothetical protein
MGSIPTMLFSCLRHEDFVNFVRNGRDFGTTSKLILLYKMSIRNENLCFFVYENKGRINFRQGVAMGPICNI